MSPSHPLQNQRGCSKSFDDGHIADAHLILGHATPLTTQKHYIQAQSLQAGAKFQAAMLERLADSTLT